MANEERNDKVVNKVIVNGITKLDLTGDDVTAEDVASGKTFHLPSGAEGTGTNTNDSNTTDATATASEILATKTAYVNKNKVTGSMPNIGAQTGSISTVAQEVTISQGYHDGSGKVSIDSTEQAKIVAGNIKEGVEILGVTGTHSGSESVKATVLNATPSWSAQDILPSSLGDYTHFSEAKIAAMSYTETENTAGGLTLSI